MDDTIAYLRECLMYNARTGTLWWKRRPRNHFTTEAAWLVHLRRDAGKQTGHTSDQAKRGGYGIISVTMNGKWRAYRAHRVAFAIYYGRWPGELDHKDRDKLNNRILNLVEKTHAHNMRNQSPDARLYKGQRRALPRGVYRTLKKRFYATICVNYRQIYLGTFDTPEEAATAYRTARAQHE